MALTFEVLQELVKTEGYRYFVAPDRPTLLLGISGSYGSYQITISAQDDGRFFQIRTLGYLDCPTNHPNLGVVLRTLAHINFQRRFVKFGWDPADGEIMAYGDMWVMDGTVTQAQLSRMLANYLPTIDLDYGRLKQTRDTGQDPGPLSPPAPPSPEGSAPGPSPGGEVDKI